MHHTSHTSQVVELTKQLGELNKKEGSSKEEMARQQKLEAELARDEKVNLLSFLYFFFFLFFGGLLIAIVVQKFLLVVFFLFLHTSNTPHAGG